MRAGIFVDDTGLHLRPAMILIPVASVVLLAFLWWGDILDRPHLVGIGLAAQLLAPVYSLIWLAGILLNAGIVIYLSIRLKLSLSKNRFVIALPGKLFSVTDYSTRSRNIEEHREVVTGASGQYKEMP